MGAILYLDTILVPLSLFLTIGYHALLWHNFKNKPFLTTFGMLAQRRREWLKDMQQGDDKMGMLAVQSLRNTLMATILTSTVSILLTLSLAALTNSTYTATHLFTNSIFGSQSSKILAVKYGSASVFSSVSFLCSSIALGCLVDSSFLINNESGDRFSSQGYTERMVERGFVLAVVGNRVLCITFSLLLWLFGPVPVVVGSVGLVWGLYELDFAGKLSKV
ncbi:hypothetical protein ACSBR2_034505 [Camellia fascicularis]